MKGRGRWLVLAALFGLVGVVCVRTTGAQSSGGEFTAAERRTLRAGELVQRPATRNEGGFNYLGGNSWLRVRAPIDRVWQTVRDPSTYPRLIPSLTDVSVIEERPGSRLVRMQHRHSFATASYYARIRIDDERRHMSFALDRSRPHDLRAGRGFITLSSYRGDTIVAWGVLADIGGGVVMQVFGPFLYDWMLKVPRCVRGEVEPGAEAC